MYSLKIVLCLNLLAASQVISTPDCPKVCPLTYALECEGSPSVMLSLGHHGDIAPLHGQPVGQAQHRDGGAVGPAWVQLNSKWCDILSLVNVVVQAGGQRQEAVGGDVEVV